MKKHRIIRMVAGVMIGIVLSVGVLAGVLALVQVDKNESIARPQVVYIFNEKTKGNKSGYNAYRIGERDGLIGTIYSKFNSAFGQSAIASIFGGSKAIKSGYDKPAGSTKSVSKNLNSTEKYTLVFAYNQNQTLTFNGQTFEYIYLFFEISSTNESAQIIFGVNDDRVDIENDTDSSTTIPYAYYYSASVNLNDLYSYVSSLDLSLN